MGKYASDIVTQAKAWLGRKESDGSHKEIIDTYNSHKPLARGYALSYSDPWCAGFVSAVAIKCGATDIIPLEVSCSKMIDLCKKIGIYIEDESRAPCVGDIVFYDWEDDGKGDNKGVPNHVGIVSSVSSDTFEVIEGNKNNAVGIRRMSMNGKFLRGYAVPKYETQGEASYIIYVVRKGDTLSRIAKLYGMSVSEVMSHNATIKNPDKIELGQHINIPVRNVPNHSETESLETENYYAIGKRFVACIEAIKELPEYKELLKAIQAEGD